MGKQLKMFSQETVETAAMQLCSDGKRAKQSLPEYIESLFLSIPKISRLELASVAEQAGL